MSNIYMSKRICSLVPMTGVVALIACVLAVGCQSGPTGAKRPGPAVSVVVGPGAASRVTFGAQRLTAALEQAGYNPTVVLNKPRGRQLCIEVVSGSTNGLAPEGFTLLAETGGNISVTGADDSGALYGCLELAKRIEASGKLPANLNFSDAPVMKLRGPCIGMQKTYILPGRKVYEYPYTPELFPFFYDKQFWQEYLDTLVENRMNTLYLWNGHPFASLVRLADYPYAVEVPEDVFRKNQEMFRYITQECDRRGIWLVQMFYNIFVSKPFAETNNISTQFAAPTPLVADYNRKSIAEFVKQYPHVGLLVCLGEALRDAPNQLNWCTNVIIPGVLAGMKEAGLKEQPPLVIRTHAMDPYAIIPTAIEQYSNLFTMTKYNGESLTTWEPRGKNQATHQAMSKLSPHLVNVHILSNLEPFRYGDQLFIQKCVQASRDRLGASGLHLYPLAYWNWPDSPDIAGPPLKQWDRDWIWFEAWARYAWNPDIPAAEDHNYWVGRLAEMYGNTNAAEKILAAYNDSGECGPRLVRRFGITEGNRQTLALGMTLDQLVRPMKYGAIPDLWLSQAPPGERLQDYVEKEWLGQPHEGETPASIIQEVLDYSQRAVDAVNAAEPLVTKNKDEFERLRNDVYCIQAMSMNYAAKVKAAEHVLRYNYSHDITDMETAQAELAKSLEWYRKLASLTEKTYHFANTMQTSQRKIPVSGGKGGKPANYHWLQLVDMYQQELDDFATRVADLKAGKSEDTGPEIGAAIAALPSAPFKLLGTNAETYTVEVGAKPFADRKYTITELAPELNGLVGIRFSHEEAKNGRHEPVEFEVPEPVQVLVGYFKDERSIWLQVPKLEFAAQADERGGVDTLIDNAATIDECPVVEIHSFRYEAGRHKLEMIGKGSFVVLGVVPQSVQINKRDAGMGKK